ncbi:bZIP transcription factor 1 [Phytophthora citrophthora]|uniref:BZIP transcription factor 1 n=1 Tax=Phytophthora citrophthora TaxID=4793 RepID=A0AAD9FYZ0_9STRA|nr:bZIP transcription factor 1 [Phytophthora citrophthora]
MSMGENDNRLEFQLKAGHDNIRQPFPAYVHIKQKYQEDSRLLAAVFTRKRTFQDSTDEEAKAKAKRFITNKRREQCRNNQARYRDRQRIHMRELQKSSVTLRQEVQELSQKRYSLCYGADTKNNAWSTVVEYFRLFRHGILISMSPLVPQVQDQEYFLRTVMASDVALGEWSGVDTLIGQWRRYSAYFSSPHLQLKRVEEQPMGVLLAKASLSLTITETTLRSVFPHLLTSTSSENLQLCTRLLGQRLECQYSVSFQWEDVTKRVTGLECKMDWITPLLQVLGNLQDVNICLEKALITPCNLIGEL